ncbi:MAG: aminoacyl-tRNA deacylase [Candidatus Accumulibacter sp.]|jgi:Cys-tRNA(Pro) deacylase|nr:aminoacyl-tRNA deacylase [Accumulibacter sp.]
MNAERAPETPATRFLKAHGVAFTTRLYTHVEHGGTSLASRAIGLDEHAVVKTLVMEDEGKTPLVVLMHGDYRVSTRELARQTHRKKIAPCTPEAATRHTGYLVGGISPFGTKKKMPVFTEKSLFDLPLVYINGGRRGFLVGIDPHEILRVLSPTLVEATLRTEDRRQRTERPSASVVSCL